MFGSLCSLLVCSLETVDGAGKYPSLSIRGTLNLIGAALVEASGGVLVARGISSKGEGLNWLSSGIGVPKCVSSNGDRLSPIRVLLCASKKSLLVLLSWSLSRVLAKS